ncbi:MAG: acyclic terpene utilization AtuA family protein [Clostridiaceae bacterium]|nr:acyclic terpene utilization AtuA family protein [Clostridiaceae bacterium]
MEEYKILSPTGIVGYGFPEESFRTGVSMKPDLIACDAGSSDPGPYYLGSGIPFTNATAVKRDMTLMLKAACELNVPLIIGTAGGSGAAPHMGREISIIKEIAEEHKLSFKLAAISAELEKGFLLEELRKGNIKSLDNVPELTGQDIMESTHIVAQMGIEPIIKALDEGAQIILCGRCYDPAAFAAPAIHKGYNKALSIHLGKLLECAAIAATPGSGSDCMIGYLGEDYFRVEPLNPTRRCTPLSVSAHTLYEKSDPILLPGPGGTLDLSECGFIAETDRCVKVTGSRYIKAERYMVKLEGARQVGYRTVSICGNRDPIFISQIDNILDGLKKRVKDNLSGSNFDYELDFIVYGKNGVMGALEPLNTIASHEIGIVIDAVADTQEHAGAVCSVARSTLLHYGYEGRIATAGNLAFPFSPSDIEVGAVYTFSVYHLLECEQPEALFARTHYEIKEGAVQ